MRTDTPVQVNLSDYSPYPFKISNIELSFDLEPSATRVRTNMLVSRTLAGADMYLDGEQLSLNDIRLNGTLLKEGDDYTTNDKGLTLLNVPDEFRLEVDVTIDPSANTALSGLYISAGRFCSQCESVGFRRITYWPDRPDVMSRFKVRIEADEDAYPILLSNGTKAASGALDDGRHFVEWDDPHLKPSYLFALCAGDYDVYEDTFKTMSGEEIGLAIHVDKGDAERAAWAMESLKASMTWDEEVFAREYDLGVFNIVAVRDFNFGAMENKGLNIFNSAYVLADEATATDADFEAIESIVGHEYFHNWTGNRITCRDWFQLCLKEGLTVFRDQEFSADMRSRPVQRIKDVIRLRGRQFAEDAGPLAHAVRPDKYASIDNLYTATVYEKGAELIRMLKTLIGDDAFAKGMQIYFDRHDGDATTIETFYACFEDASGTDLSEFRRWYSQPGTPTVEVRQDYDSWGGETHLILKQINPVVPGVDEPKPQIIPMAYAIFSKDGEKLAEDLFILEGKEAEITIPASSGPPLISLNRGFSAPIRLDHKVSDDQHLALAKIDDDPFNQWDNFQSLLKKNLVEIAYGDNSEADTNLIEAIADTVRSKMADPAFASLLTRIPDVGELFQERSPVDPAALHHSYKVGRRALARALSQDAMKIMAEPSPHPFRPDAEQSGVRALRISMISLLSELQSEESNALIKRLFDTAPNMTESLATLRALCVADASQKEDALAAFEAQWSDNPLVMDKWFAVQAGTGTAESVQTLTSHPAYDLSNPNRVRSVLAVFAMQNLAEFHASDGSGYELVASAAAEIDGKNPALAARLLTAFEQWKSLVPDTAQKAETALKNLMQNDLSENVADIISRTLK